MRLISLILLISITNALQQVFKHPQSQQKIAIIGAGAGGSSAAYHLQKFTSHGYQINIYDKNSYIGGRSTTIGNYNPKFGQENQGFEVELGASVFVSANKILQNAVNEFNLTLIKKDFNDLYPEKFSGSYGVWDGSKFVYNGDSNDGIFKFIYKLLRKYGLSPIRTYSLVKKVVNVFLNEYYAKQFPFIDLNTITNSTGLIKATNSTGLDYLKNAKIGDSFLNDLVQAATRVNYRSNLNDIHGLEAAVSLAADDGTVSVKGGNYQIFEKFIDYSKANLFLNTKISTIEKLSNGKWKLDQSIEQFDHVIIASPYSQSNLKINDTFNKVQHIKNVAYRDLFVTYVKTQRTNPVNHEYFGNDTNDKILPETILTTLDTAHSDEPPFYSVSIVDYDNSTDSIIYKIFSPNIVTPEYLKGYLFSNTSGVSIHYSKLWKAYPHLKPVNTFDEFAIGSNLWYLNTMEQFISTMETSALAGANVAGLISLGKNTTVIGV